MCLWKLFSFLTTVVPKPLVELHIKLLRKLGKSVTTDRWEKYLAKVSTVPSFVCRFYLNSPHRTRGNASSGTQILLWVLSVSQTLKVIQESTVVPGNASPLVLICSVNPHPKDNSALSLTHPKR